MKTSPPKRRKSGFASFVLVLATGAILTLLTLYAYRRALIGQAFQSQVQLRVDYSEKEEAILRSIVAITPNRAIRAMQDDSNSNTTISNPLRWENIFTESLVLANARTSISSGVVSALGFPNLRVANTGDSASMAPSEIFKAISPEVGYVSAGINRSLGTGYPAPLTSNDTATTTRDAIYPIISNRKIYGNLAQSGVGLPVADYPKFNLLKYPKINFGYGQPGADFVAKRNWWAFSVDVGDSDDDKTFLARKRRDFVLSIYEIPSQLAISASSFMSLGQHASGEAWQNVTIEGGIFVGKAAVEGDTAIAGLASRRGMTLSSGTTIGGQSFGSSPFTPGVREAYQVTQGEFFPVSLASESGRAAFVPISRGGDYFDRFACADDGSTLSSTTWNDYSIGARQCAMRLEISAEEGAPDPVPTVLHFECYLPNGNRYQEDVQLKDESMKQLPAGYKYVCADGASVNLDTLDEGRPVDVAYGAGGGYTFRQGLSGTIPFTSPDTFGDPKPESPKSGYWRRRSPFEIKSLPPTALVPDGQKCVVVYPERFPKWLEEIGAAGPEINSSLVVNVDYSVSGLNNSARKPKIPCTDNDYGVILRECANLTSFTKGFSLVTNLRLHVGDHFNQIAATPPTGYTPAEPYFPPCSLFAPEKRYGVDVDPLAVTLGGQIGSLASDSEVDPVRPLDSKDLKGNPMSSGRLTVNLRPIRHPAELPPITMMNWLILLEERRKEFH